MTLRALSFDVQGTITDARFGDRFWREVLPLRYAEKNGLTVDAARAELAALFKEIGPYDIRYYSVDHWCDVLGFTFVDVVPELGAPQRYPEMIALLDELAPRVRLIATSSTTHGFLSLELGAAAGRFSRVYSSIDDFGIAGKPPELYSRIAKEEGVDPSELLHIGDDPVMDVENARKAGCAAFFFDKKEDRALVVDRLRTLLVRVLSH